MKRLFLVAAITSLVATMASISWAATSVNGTKSNTFKIIYSADGMTAAQAAALGAQLDKVSKVDAITIKQTLQKLFIPSNFKVIRIIPRQAPGKLPTVLLLTNPAHEAEARRIATGDVEWPSASGAVGTKSPPIK